ncbi:MAG: MotA/TolQ/ExbB proton channel family protein [Pseudomonadota bacterium]|jgi:biopolymer transport protein ExbB
MNALAQPGFNLARFWTQGDAISHLVAIVLIAMSLISWYFILSKLWSTWRVRKSARFLDQFWQAAQMSDAITSLEQTDLEQVFTPLAKHCLAISQASDQPVRSMEAEVDIGERLTRRLRQDITRATLRLEGGLTLLASIGATAPFVGLLGTVWGIYHALAAVSFTGTVQIDKIAGPVGEALIMTALGLVVAIPAVLAYNALGRMNRVTLAELDGFAHDLHSYLSTGKRQQAK